MAESEQESSNSGSMRPLLIVLGTSVLLVMGVFAGLMLLMISLVAVIAGNGGSDDAAGGCRPASSSSDGVTSTGPDAPEDVKAEQIENAKKIDEKAQELGLPGKASEIAIIAAMGESTLINIDYGDEAQGVTNADGSATTSKGLFQQQTSTGWGTVEQVTDPAYATESFLTGQKHDGNGGLASVSGWQDREITEVIHEVQANADASHYAKSYDSARAIIEEADIDIERSGDESKMEEAGLTGEGKSDGDGGDGGSGGSGEAQTALNDDCTTKTKSWDGDLGDGEWTTPLPDSDVTGAGNFGPRNIAGYPEWANQHAGLDLATDMVSYSKGGPVVAPTKMKVLDIYEPDGCVQTKLTGEDGDPEFGMGFCHLGDIQVSKGDTLERGDVLGTESNQGEGLGNPEGGHGFITHLHFEIYPPETPESEMVVPGNDSAIDPAPILREKGAWPSDQKDA